jgi:hypothetical protein
MRNLMIQNAIHLLNTKFMALYWKTVSFTSPVSPHWWNSLELYVLLVLIGGTWWRSWLRHYAASQKATGSIPDGVIGILHWHIPSVHTMALGLTQSLTEMNTRKISCGVKAAGAYGWQPYHLPVPIVLKSGSLNLLEPSGPALACNGIALPLPYSY